MVSIKDFHHTTWFSIFLCAIEGDCIVGIALLALVCVCCVILCIALKKVKDDQKSNVSIEDYKCVPAMHRQLTSLNELNYNTNTFDGDIDSTNTYISHQNPSSDSKLNDTFDCNKHPFINHIRSNVIGDVLCIIFYLTWSIHYTIISIYGILYNNTPQFTPHACVANWLINYWLCFARLSCGIFFVSRLYKTVKGSVFAISKFIFKTTIGYIVAICFTYDLMEPIIAIFNTKENSLIDSECVIILNEFNHRFISMYIGITLISFTDILLNIILLRLYLKKMTLLSIACNEINSVIHLQSKRISKKNRQRLKENALFLLLAEKTTIIVICVTMSNFIGIIIMGLQIGDYWLIFDNITRSVCCYMTYHRGKKMYKVIFFKSKQCFECCKICCFCCCKVHTLPQQLKLLIFSNNNSNTVSSTPNTNTATTIKSTRTEKTITSNSIKVPMLKSEDVMDDSLFVGEFSGPSLPSTPKHSNTPKCVSTCNHQ